jgi:hypothetical protein
MPWLFMTWCSEYIAAAARRRVLVLDHEVRVRRIDREQLARRELVIEPRPGGVFMCAGCYLQTMARLARFAGLFSAIYSGTVF